MLSHRPYGTGHPYRFDLDQRVPVRPQRWHEQGGRLEVSDPDGADTVEPGSVRWLADSTGPRRVRFSMRLRPADHVVGFGERFHGLDQRGETLDAVVFEQYKHQG